MKMRQGLIVATPELMLCWLVHITDKLLPPPVIGESYFMFRSGAKLIYVEENRWHIHSYADGQHHTDRRDWKAAVKELKAAGCMHQAQSYLNAMEVELQVPNKFSLTYLGMNAVYPSGERSSSRR